MCDSSCTVAEVACTQLGYPGAVGKWHILHCSCSNQYHFCAALRQSASDYYGYYYYIDDYQYYCYNHHTNISQCSSTYNPTCGDYNDALGLVCYNYDVITGDYLNTCAYYMWELY